MHLWHNTGSSLEQGCQHYYCTYPRPGHIEHQRILTRMMPRADCKRMELCPATTLLWVWLMRSKRRRGWDDQVSFFSLIEIFNRLFKFDCRSTQSLHEKHVNQSVTCTRWSILETCMMILGTACRRGSHRLSWFSWLILFHHLCIGWRVMTIVCFHGRDESDNDSDDELYKWPEWPLRWRSSVTNRLTRLFGNVFSASLFRRVKSTDAVIFDIKFVRILMDFPCFPAFLHKVLASYARG